MNTHKLKYEEKIILLGPLLIPYMIFTLNNFLLKERKKMKVTSLSRVQLFATPWLLRPWDYFWSLSDSSVHEIFFLAYFCRPGKSTGMGCHFLLQVILLTQGSNPSLLNCRQMLYRLIHLGSPYTH